MPKFDSNAAAASPQKLGRLFLVSASAAAMASIFWLYFKRNQVDLFSWLRQRFAFSSASSQGPRLRRDTQKTTPVVVNQSAEFIKRREMIENSLRRRSSDSTQKHTHLLKNISTERATRPGKNPSKTRLNLTPVKKPTEEDEELHQALEEIQSFLENKDKAEFKLLQEQLFPRVDIILDRFTQLDLNRQREMSQLLCQLSAFDAFKGSIKVSKLVRLLDAQFSIRNSNLFENYAFNNTIGETSTKIVLNLLNVVSNSAQMSSNLKEYLEENQQIECALNLLHSYAVELEKNRNNVKRIREVQLIKVRSVEILSSFVCCFLAHESEPTMRSNAKHFVDCLAKLEPIFLPAIDQKSNVEKPPLIGTSINKGFADVYIELIDKFLQLVVDLELKQFFEPQPNSFYGYLGTDIFYKQLNDYFKSPKMVHLNQEISRIFRFLSFTDEAAAEKGSSESLRNQN